MAGTRKAVPKKTSPQKEIDAGAIIQALESHILGHTEMTPLQVNAGIALLKLALIPQKDETSALHESALQEID